MKIRWIDEPDNLVKWMQGLQSFELISGVAGQPGAKSRLVIKSGKRELEMIETILTRNLPEEFSGTYETRGVLNKVTNRFVKLSEAKTKYIAEHEFQFSGFMKIIGFLMPSAMKKQSVKYMLDFKMFAESNT
jgi:hypothetical protein